jgi:long-chain fatty acid transport protein
LALLLGALAGPAQGAGYALQDFDGKAEGMSNAFAATADNPSAVFFNPAGMSQLDGFQASLSGVYIQGWIHYKPETPDVAEANTKDNPIFYPTFFATYAITDSLNVGLGVFEPFGLSINWGDDWAGRYIISKARIDVVEINPCVSYKIPLSEGNSIAGAAGFGAVNTTLHLKQAILLGPGAGFNDGTVDLHGDTWGYTWNVGVLASLFDRKVRIGAGYRAPVQDYKVHGTADFNTGHPPPPGAPSGGTRVFTETNHPDQFRGGLAVSPLEPLTLEVDFTWTNWTKVDKVFLEFDDIGQTQVLDFGFVDSYFIGVGVDYKLSSMFSLRAGGYWDETPVRNVVRSPTLPDANRQGFSVGLGFSPIPAVTIDASYLTVFFSPVSKHNDIGANVPVTNATANGDYTTFAHVAVVTFTIKLGGEEKK